MGKAIGLNGKHVMLQSVYLSYLEHWIVVSIDKERRKWYDLVDEELYQFPSTKRMRCRVEQFTLSSKGHLFPLGFPFLSYYFGLWRHSWDCYVSFDFRGVSTSDAAAPKVI